MTSPVTCRNEDHPSILVIEKNTYTGKLPHTKKGKVITMKVYVGIDAHTTNFTLATRIEGSEKAINTSTLTPEVSSIVKYCDSIKKHYGEDVEIISAYEAGGLGFSLQKQLESEGIKCLVLAPTSIPGTDLNRRRKKKTDKRDAEGIADALHNKQYSSVYIPDEEDEAIRDYIRMREDHRKAWRVLKQQMVAFLHRHGYHYKDGKNYWTKKHLDWIRELPLEGVLKNVLDEYMLRYQLYKTQLEEIDRSIEEFAESEKYRENVHKLICFKGIQKLTALAIIVEVGDFSRFLKAKSFTAFLGLVSAESSSSNDHNLYGITKQGNTFIRRLLVEAAQCFCRATQQKSKLLIKRQEGNTSQTIAYADKANERLRKRYYHLVMHNKKSHNTATVAVARELASFIWGMMSGNTNLVTI